MAAISAARSSAGSATIAISAFVGMGGPLTAESRIRGAKLRFAEVDPALIDQALQSGRPLVGRVVLTDEHGWPRCARVHPPAIAWSMGDA